MGPAFKAALSLVTCGHERGIGCSHLRGGALHDPSERAFSGGLKHSRNVVTDRHMPSHRMILASLALLLSGVIAPLYAETPIFYASGNKAINGYDVVAYFDEGAPVQGKTEIAVMWKGVIWRFASEEHREAFEANPWAYAPQYGGYCAYGVSLGYRDSTEPDAWYITNGKLYLIRTRFVRSIWRSDMTNYIAQADANWPGILRR